MRVISASPRFDRNVQIFNGIVRQRERDAESIDANEILQFSEYEQIDFVRTLMQHMSHHQLGVIDTTLQVLNFN